MYFKKILITLVIISVNVTGFAQDATCEPESDKKALKYIEKANEAITKGDFTGASTNLNNAIEDYPDFYEAWYLLGKINLKQSNTFRKSAIALESFLKVIEICPSYENYYSHFYLGKISYGAKNWGFSYNHLDAFIRNVKTEIVTEKTDLRSVKAAERESKAASRDYEEAEFMLKWAKFYERIYSNKVPFDPKPIGGLSTVLDEYVLIISPDNELAFFTRKIDLPSKSTFVKEDPYIERFCFAKRINGRFEQGAPMAYPFNQNQNEGTATITIDNKRLYYVICKMVKNYYNCDICESEFSFGNWTDPEPLGSNINNSDTWETMPSISSDGKTLYFISDRPGGIGGYDIYKSNKNEAGEWSPSVNLGSLINTPGNEMSPFIHSDCRTLYFSSGSREDRDGTFFEGHQGLGKMDIFLIRIDKNGNWTKPQNIGYPINSEDDEFGFFVSSDGKTGYFASNKLKGMGGWDLYSFNLYDDARPQEVQLLKGELKDDQTSKAVFDAKIEIKNVATKEIREIPVDNETGKYVAALLVKNDYILTVKKEDYAYETKYISRKENKFQIPLEMNINIKPLIVGQSYPLNDINFQTNSDSLFEESKLVIDGFIQYLNDYPKISISIYGHTDAIGSQPDNLILSEKRAKAVYEYMINANVNSTRLSYKGFGEDKPIADNATPEGRAKNRRTEFVIIRK